jgi:predicted nuclease of predicted toxin-antitoxin system
VKLLFDENLSPHFPAGLADIFPNSAHVQDCGLGSSDDLTIWKYAKTNGFTLVSKDSDFQERSVIEGHPPKLVWLRAANCSSDEIEELLRKAEKIIKRFIEKDEEACLILGVRPK